MIVLFCLNEHDVVVCLGKENALVLDESVEAAIENAAEHSWMDAMVDFGFEQLHIDRNGKLVGDDLT